MPARRSARSPRKPPLSVESLWALKRIGTPTLSPDGRLACAPVTSYDMEKNEGVTELWMFPTGLGAPGGAASGAPAAASSVAPSGAGGRTGAATPSKDLGLTKTPAAARPGSSAP